MAGRDAYLSVLRSVWGYDNFRHIQADIIESIGSGKDTLGLMPTGGGKSLTFQVPALCMEGTCLVVTPLIALMKDQVRELRQKGIKATAMHSDMPHEACVAAMENCILGGYKFLYVSPERLSSPFFLKKLRHLNVSFIAVDEAHCISQWGYDFRPAYLQIARFRGELPHAPVLALTATATPEVVEDIQRQLNFPAPNVFKMSFRRPNLAYMVQHVSDKEEALLQTLKSIKGSTIIYIRNRNKCEEIARHLQARGFSATCFHAGLQAWEKDERQTSWIEGKTRIIVATNAFGMGINKPDVRLVMHMNPPDSIEEYFQEAGRAGRDGQKAYSIILCDQNTTRMMANRLEQAFPAEEYVQDVYERLCGFLQIAVGDGMNVVREFDIEAFCRTSQLFPLTVRNALTILERAGYLQLTEADDLASRIHIIASRNSLLRNATDDEERLFTAMFRHYGGIFADHVVIDETAISRETGLSADFIYQTLTEMHKRNVVHYIPRKRMPRVTFLQRRVDKEDVVLPRSVYADRKKCHEKRLTAMRDYCTADECRSQLLLQYFGETDSTKCGICDVCQDSLRYAIDKESHDAIRQLIVDQFCNGPVRPVDLKFNGVHPDQFWLVFNAMCEKEEIVMRDFLLYLN